MREGVDIAAMVLVGCLLILISFVLAPNAYTCIGYCDDSGSFNFIHETK